MLYRKKENKKGPDTALGKFATSTEITKEEKKKQSIFLFCPNLLKGQKHEQGDRVAFRACMDS